MSHQEKLTQRKIRHEKRASALRENLKRRRQQKQEREKDEDRPGKKTAH
jgi:hypothetical protein